jgi:UDP-galactopyranose mutase
MSAECYIAFGAGGAFQNIVTNRLLPVPIKYAVDNHYAGSEFQGIPIKRPAALQSEPRDHTKIIVFAMSSAMYRSVRAELEGLGFRPEHILYYGDVFFDGLQQRLHGFGVNLSRCHYAFAQSASMVFPLDNHSSSLGPAILLGLANAGPTKVDMRC